MARIVNVSLENTWLFLCRLRIDVLFAPQTAKYWGLQQQTLNRLVDAGLIPDPQAAGDVGARARKSAGTSTDVWMYSLTDGSQELKTFKQEGLPFQLTHMGNIIAEAP